MTVGFYLQILRHVIQVKVAQLCPTLWPHRLYSSWNSRGQNTGVGSLSLLQWIFPTQVSHIASGFFTIWATREALVTYRWIVFVLLFSSLLSYTLSLSTHLLTHRLLQVCSLFWKCLHEYLPRVPLCACVGASLRPVPGREWTAVLCSLQGWS